MKIDESLDVLRELVESLELVFHYDWEYSAGRLDPDDVRFYIAPSGTFLHPFPDLSVRDGEGELVVAESNNWANRGSFLAAYRRARRWLDDHDLSDPYERDDEPDDDDIARWLDQVGRDPG